MSMVKIYLKPGKEIPVLRFHPWVFSGAIARMEGDPADGDVVEVYSKRGELLGAGHFHHGSIAVRLLSFGEADPESGDFWIGKFRNALSVRATVGLVGSMNTNCFRLVHGEGDGLSGLIVDVYGSTAVLQCHSIGMHRQRNLIAAALKKVLGKQLQAVYDKSAETLPPKYAENQSNEFLWSAVNAPAGAEIIEENDVRFKVDWLAGQKTGFFLDQRDNRQLLARFAAGKTLLNAFCYTGGFSCYALRAGAALVHSVDISAKAMELTEENVALNAPFPGRHDGFTDDVLRFLKTTETRYEVMVVDPPAYAKSLEKRHNAVQGYKRLNAEALKKVAPGGILFTFSCSQVVDRELFYNTVAAAAMEVGRPVRVLHHLTQGADHPVSMFHPEGAYLKGLVLYVE
ncbi:MAG: class I SAM-dependent rRNA methyltransferase [Haliscomenobacteraceae bacterium CHB4]|nr:class I SAM-dependent rRNA methyltransferase [Haliscomenobacteraceae bacterium CHB4]